jgi:hypothetical protein
MRNKQREIKNERKQERQKGCRLRAKEIGKLKV